MFRHPLLLVLLAVALASPALAATPQHMNYQGILTDGGSPVPDGNYTVTFRIYSVSVGGSELWSEARLVSTTGGLFTITLGLLTPLTDSVFDGTPRYMGISVEADPEMAPRAELTTVPFAYRVSTVDGASGGTVTSTTTIQGDVLLDDVLKVNNGADSVILLDGVSNIARNWGSDGNGENWRLWGGSFGQLYLNTNNAANTRMVEVSAPASGGELELHDTAGVDYIRLDAGETGDDAAVLPTGSVNALENLDEPGVASNKDASFIYSGVSQTFVLRSISCPAPGYVLAIGSGTFEFSHVNGVTSTGEMFVSDTAGTSTNQPQVHFQISINGVSGAYSIPMSPQGIFEVPAGVSTFYLRGSSNTLGQVTNTRLSLVYIPTAYGTVTSNVLPQTGDEPAESSLSEADERAAAEKFSLERLSRELEAQQAKLTALANQIEEIQNSAMATPESE